MRLRPRRAPITKGGQSDHSGRAQQSESATSFRAAWCSAGRSGLLPVCNEARRRGFEESEAESGKLVMNGLGHGRAQDLDDTDGGTKTVLAMMKLDFPNDVYERGLWVGAAIEYGHITTRLAGLRCHRVRPRCSDHPDRTVACEPLSLRRPLGRNDNRNSGLHGIHRGKATLAPACLRKQAFRQSSRSPLLGRVPLPQQGTTSSAIIEPSRV